MEATSITALLVQEESLVQATFEAHAALIPDAQYGTPVFSNQTHSCAQVYKTNAEAKTCQSPNQTSWHGRNWGIVSGHLFDTDLSNPYATGCPGCIDWLYTTP